MKVISIFGKQAEPEDTAAGSFSTGIREYPMSVEVKQWLRSAAADDSEFPRPLCLEFELGREQIADLFEGRLIEIKPEQFKASGEGSFVDARFSPALLCLQENGFVKCVCSLGIEMYKGVFQSSTLLATHKRKPRAVNNQAITM